MDDFCRELTSAGSDEARQLQVREKHFQIELARYVNHEMSRSAGAGPLCLMDSMDHIPPATEVANYLRLIRGACPELHPKHSNLPAFFSEARKTVRVNHTKIGELREPSQTKNPYLWLIPNCPSARVGIKIANDVCSTLLEKWADPLVAIANLQGAGFPVAHLQIAWKHLLLNHAHDSICGCSIDQVHRDMMYRFHQARVLGEQLRAQSIGFLTKSCTDLARSSEEFTVTVINPLPEAREEVVIFPIDVPLNYPTEFRESFFSQALKSFALENENGQPIPYQRLSFVPQMNERSQFAKFCFQSDGMFSRYQVAARIALPGMGFTSLRVCPSTMPVRTSGSLRTAPDSAANEFLCIQIQPNGALTLTDRTTGEVYRDLLMFEHRSEIADGWFHAHSLNDEQLLSSGNKAEIAVVHDGPELVTFRSTITLTVPLRFDESTQRPTPETVELPITSLITLRRGAKVVEVETTVENTAEDHRLRMLLPSDCPEARTYLAHQPFDFVEREIELDSSTASWQEMEIAEKPFLGLQAVSGAGRGLAVLSAAGVHEGGVADDERRTMLVTLLRSFRRTITTSGETDGLEKGKTTFRFALMPFDGELPRARALSELARLQAGLQTRQTGKRPSGFPPLAGKAPSTQGFLECQSGCLSVSAIKIPEEGEGLILRLWNPTGQPQKESIRFWREILFVEELDLGEEPLGETEAVKWQDETMEVTAKAHQIVTFRVMFVDQE
jgi:alpha-mannosidase/mannosylglycerate hydrolase